MIPLLLVTFYGWSLSGPYSLGKFFAVGLVGLWLSFGTVKRLGVVQLFYLAVLTLTTITSADPWLSTWSLFGTYAGGLIAAFCLAPYWCCVGPEDRPGLELGIRASALLMALVGGLQLLGHLLPFELPAGNRVYSTMGSPVYVGAMVALAFPFCRTWIERGLVLALLAATGSRGAYAAVACGAIYFYWPSISNRARTWGLLAIGGGLIAAMYMRPPSDLGRIVTWAAAVDAFKARPWLGWGTGNYLMVAALWRNPAWSEVYGNTTQDHAHNLFLEAAATSGAIGLAALAAFLFVLWRSSDRVARAALLGVFIVGMLNPLPLVAKALCLALAGSSQTVKLNITHKTHCLVNTFLLICFFCLAYLIHLDRMVTFYGSFPWSFSSVEAAYRAGILKENIERRNFKL